MIDTNVFLLVAAYFCLFEEDVPPARRAAMLRDIRGRDDDLPPERFDDLWRAFHSAQRRLITQHVTAEAYSLCRRWNYLSTRMNRVWRAILLEGLLVEEHTCSLRDLYADERYRWIVDKAGPADAGLILTAARERAAIISEDAGLVGCANRRLIPVVTLWQIDQLWDNPA